MDQNNNNHSNNHLAKNRTYQQQQQEPPPLPPQPPANLLTPTGEVIDAKNTLQSFAGVNNNNNDNIVVGIVPDVDSTEQRQQQQQQQQHRQEPRLPNGEIINAKNINQSYDHIEAAQQRQRQQHFGNDDDDGTKNSNNVINNNETNHHNNANGSNSNNDTSFVAQAIPILSTSLPQADAELYQSNKLYPDNNNDSQNNNNNDMTANTTSNGNKNRGILILALSIIVLSVTIAAGIGVYCGSGNCSGSKSDNSPIDSPQASPQTPPQQQQIPSFNPNSPPIIIETPTNVPVPSVTTSAPSINNQNATDNELIITSFINNITLLNDTVILSKYGTTPEDMALKYLIDEDPVFINTNLTEPITDEAAFRLRQRYSLLTLWYQQFNQLIDVTNGGSILWTNTDGWMDDPQECNWYGITCNDQNSATELNFMTNNVYGTLSPDLGLLTSIEIFHFGDNRLFGIIPPSLQQQWTQLSIFVTHNNYDLGGSRPIDSVLNGDMWPLITVLDVAYNGYIGSIPDSIQNWTNIETFVVTGNTLSGTLPNWIGTQWTKLRSIGLEACFLSGTIPSSIGLLSSSLFLFGASYNHFNGSIPESMGQLSLLAYLDLSLSQLTGTLPESIHQWTSMENFYVGNNHLVGTIPSLIGSSWPVLEQINLSNNQLNGTIPFNVGNWTILQRISLTNNSLTGPIPSSITRWEASILEILISDTMLTGTIPSDLCNTGRTIEIVIDCFANITCDCCTTASSTCR